MRPEHVRSSRPETFLPHLRDAHGVSHRVERLASLMVSSGSPVVQALVNTLLVGELKDEQAIPMLMNLLA
jgi:hypothetical protein